MKKREVLLDIIRIWACVMIVLMHSPMPGLDTSGLVLCGISYLTAPGIGLFFMVSGALLLRGNSGNIFETKSFLQKRFSKILIPVVFWSIVGWGLDVYGIRNDEMGILWFMYCLSGMYLLTPILSRWLSMADKKEIEFYLLVWMVTLCVPFVKTFVSMNESDTSWLYYFHGYVGYYVMGYYLQHFVGRGTPMPVWKKILLGIVFLSISVILPLTLLILQVEVDFYSVFWYLSITVALQCIVWWLIIKKIVRNVKELPRFVVELSKLSFGIYLIHILVMRNILWETTWMKEMNGSLQILVCASSTFVISVIVSWGISRVKYIKAVIGY